MSPLRGRHLGQSTETSKAIGCAAWGYSRCVRQEPVLFWTALEALLSNQACPPEALNHLLQPQPLVPLGSNLHTQGLLRAATDASDGLYAAVVALTTPFSLGAVLRPLEWQLSPAVQSAARQYSVEAWRLALGFGDLQLVAAVAPDAVDAASGAGWQMGHEALILGTVTSDGVVAALGSSGLARMSNFDNERFSRESQFVDGLAGYRRRLLSTPLTG